jgi:hypothetical protein
VHGAKTGACTFSASDTKRGVKLAGCWVGIGPVFVSKAVHQRIAPASGDYADRMGIIIPAACCAAHGPQCWWCGGVLGIGT